MTNDGVFWMAVAALAAVCALAITLIGLIVKYAYHRGVTDSRIDEMEKKVLGQVAKTDGVSALTEAVNGLKMAFEHASTATHERLTFIEQAFMRRTARSRGGAEG